MSAMPPAQIGAAMLVPPWSWFVLQAPSTQRTIPVLGSASAETSGMDRPVADVNPFWNEGREKNLLTPKPPPVQRLPWQFGCVRTPAPHQLSVAYEPVFVSTWSDVPPTPVWFS